MDTKLFVSGKLYRCSFFHELFCKLWKRNPDCRTSDSCKCADLYDEYFNTISALGGVNIDEDDKEAAYKEIANIINAYDDVFENAKNITNKFTKNIQIDNFGDSKYIILNPFISSDAENFESDRLKIHLTRLEYKCSDI